MASYTALLAGKIFNGPELEVMRHACVILRDGVIEKILPQAAFLSEPHDQCELVDLGNLTLMPGMIECHNHAGMDARLPGHLEMMEGSECELTVTAVKTLQDDLLSGVTTARCMGDRHYLDIKLRKEIQRNRLIGPNLLCAGIGMRCIHGHGFVGMAHSGPEEFRRTARENMLQGADLLKIFATPGMPPISGSFIPHFLTREEIRTVVEEAAGKNLPVASHCIGGQGLVDCVEEGVDVIEHAYCIDDAGLDLVTKYDCWLDLTSGILLDPSREEFLSPAGADCCRRTRDAAFSCMEKVMKSGVKFALGTDAYHGLLYREAEYAVQCGASSLNAVKGVTVNAAKMCRIDQRTGSIQPGLAADLIAVDGDPLEDISALRQVAFVMKQGQIFKKTIL